MERIAASLAYKCTSISSTLGNGTQMVINILGIAELPLYGQALLGPCLMPCRVSCSRCSPPYNSKFLILLVIELWGGPRALMPLPWPPSAHLATCPLVQDRGALQDASGPPFSAMKPISPSLKRTSMTEPSRPSLSVPLHAGYFCAGNRFDVMPSRCCGVLVEPEGR